MKVIRTIIEHMDNTLEEAEDYYKDYVMYKDEFPKVANISLEMAQTHLTLYGKWHEMIVVLINEYKMKHGDIPKIMQELYDYEHKKIVEEYDEVAYKVKSAKGGY